MKIEMFEKVFKDVVVGEDGVVVVLWEVVNCMNCYLVYKF